MDATRALMLARRVLTDVDAQWIGAVRNPRGWAVSFPGEPTNLERTCDGLDTW